MPIDKFGGVKDRSKRRDSKKRRLALRNVVKGEKHLKTNGVLVEGIGIINNT